MSLENLEVSSTEMDSSIQVTDDVAAPASAEAISDVVDPAAVAAPATPDAVAPVAPAYQPNFKYTIKGQEKEIEEMFRPLIKDAESEKKLKELFEKAEGIDFVKEDRKAIKTEYEGFKQQIMPYMQEYHKFTTMRDKGNLGAAFQVAGITDEQIFQYALQKLEMSQNPHQASLYQNHTEASLRELELEARLQHFETTAQQMQVQAFAQDLDRTLQQHSDIVSQVEQRIGKNGAFKEEVIQYGTFEHQRGNNLTVAQAVDAIVNKYKPFITTSAAPFNNPQAPQAPAHKAPSTIPNTGSSNVSVIKAMPKSLDDLRKLRDQEIAG
jgi:hypothetical protein